MKIYHIITILWQYLHFLNSNLTKKMYYFWDEIPIKHFINSKLGLVILLTTTIIKSQWYFWKKKNVTLPNKKK